MKTASAIDNRKKISLQTSRTKNPNQQKVTSGSWSCYHDYQAHTTRECATKPQLSVGFSISKENVECVPTQDSGLLEDATRQTERKKKLRARTWRNKGTTSETKAETQKGRHKEERAIIVSSNIGSTLNSVIRDRRHRLCATGFYFRPLPNAYSNAILSPPFTSL